MEGTSILLKSRSSDAEESTTAAEDFLRRLSQRVRSRLVSRCSRDFQVRLVPDIEVKSIGEVIRDDDFGKTAVYGLLRFDAQRVPGLACMQRSLLTRIIGAQLGDEAGSDEVIGARPLSPVESRLAHRIFLELAEDLQDVWPVRPVPTVVLEGKPGTSRVIGHESYSEEVYVAILDFGPPEDNDYGLMCVTIPTQVLRTTRPGGGLGPGDESPLSPASFERVMPIQIELVAEMARLPMRIRDLRALQVGDILPLGALDGATIRVGDKPIIVAEAGHSNGQRSVRVIKKFG